VDRTEESPARVASRKRRIFALLTVASPLLLLGLLELGLRASGYGTNLSLFTTRIIRGKTYYLLNHEVKARYFPGIRFAPITSQEYFTLPKPPQAFRIFVLGGSSAAGYPYGTNGSFSAFLRNRLERIFPERHIEVINLGMTGTNSFTVLDLARELPAWEPDLLIVYDGHNEFYGGLGVQSRGLFGGFRPAAIAYLRLLHFRTFLLLREAYAWLRSLVLPSHGDAPRDVSLESLSQGKEVPYGSPVYAEALRNFMDNLADLRAFCAEQHLPVILASQVSNLRGQPPFVSGGDPSLPDSVRTAFDGDRREAERAWNEKKWPDALSAYRKASSLNSLHAATHFAIGRCLDILGDRRGARLEYVRARDLDELRFRASSDFNSAILSQTRGMEVGTVDMERLFMANSPDSLIGNELILEHLHPNSSGYFLMAKGYAAMMRRMGLIADDGEWGRRDTFSDRVLWNERTVTDLDERIALERTARMTSTYPFAARSLSVPAEFPHDSLQAFAVRVVDRVWGAGEAHRAAAEYYTQRGDLKAAERELKTVIALDSLEVSSYLGLARLYIREGRTDQATGVLAASLSAEPTWTAYAMLGDIAFDSGNNAAALASYEKALPLTGSPEDQATILYQEALADLRMRDAIGARDALERSIRANPHHVPSLDLLRAIQGPGTNP
jgi:tetratricopeptide (TPR) repeat protein